MRVLLTGADGYIGAVLGPKLLERDHDAVGLDTGLYRRGLLYADPRPSPFVIDKDVREVSRSDLTGFEAVVHLAELSNDPLGENDPALTFAINHAGSVRLAELARAAGVRRFVYASSCSIYGAGGEAWRTERSELAPQTAYARCKALVERDLGQLSSATFEPVVLRNATAFGPSPRQRFDLVLNNLAGWAHTRRTIRVMSDGSPWRPLVHVDDIGEAIVAALEAPREAVAGEAFNVGADEQNYTVRELAEIVGETFRGCETTFGATSGDRRSYRVSFAKIGERMPAFACQTDARRGVAELKRRFEQIRLTAATFDATPFTRLAELKRLRETGRLDRALYWTDTPNRPSSDVCAQVPA